MITFEDDEYPKLNSNQIRFVREYLIDLNATDACLRAGYSKKNPKNAHKIGPRLLKEPWIEEAIQKEMDKRAKKTGLNSQKILESILELALFDIGRAYDDNGAMLPLKQMPPDVRRAISSLDVSEININGNKMGEIKKVKYADKLKALELLGRHLKLFTDRVEHSGKVTLEELVAGSFSNEQQK